MLLHGVEISLNPAYGSQRFVGCEWQTASLDRINSSIGYTIDNVQWVHKKINMMKMDLSQEEFINYCRLVVKNNE